MKTVRKKIADDAQLQALGTYESMLPEKARGMLSICRLFHLALQSYEDWYKENMKDSNAYTPEQVSIMMGDLMTNLNTLAGDMISELSSDVEQTAEGRKINVIKNVTEDAKLKQLSNNDTILSPAALDLLSIQRLVRIAVNTYAEWIKAYKFESPYCTPEDCEQAANELEQFLSTVTTVMAQRCLTTK